jgi:hypothetical protein
VAKLLFSLRSKKYVFLWLGLTLLIIAVYAAFGPAEKSLGTHVRIVYVHGAWVWVSLAAFAAAGLVGLMALVFRKDVYFAWTRALGFTGVVFWISYLPLSLWAMQSNWNGLYLAEPRWRLAMAFAIAGLVAQIGLVLMARPFWTAVINFIFTVVLFFSLTQTSSVMHPPSPILDSGVTSIQLYFAGLVLLTAFAAWLVAQIWLSRPH